MQKRLLTEPDLNIARALELAKSVVAAALETKGFKDPSSIAGASAKSSMSEKPPPPSHRAEIRRGPANREDLIS